MQNTSKISISVKDLWGGSASGPHFSMKVVDVGNFDQEFRTITRQTASESSPEYKPEDREDYFSVFVQWGFLFLLLFGFWMLMRRMTGGAALAVRSSILENQKLLFLMLKVK